MDKQLYKISSEGLRLERNTFHSIYYVHIIMFNNFLYYDLNTIQFISMFYVNEKKNSLNRMKVKDKSTVSNFYKRCAFEIQNRVWKKHV